MLPSSKQFLTAPLTPLRPGQKQLSDSHLKMAPDDEIVSQFMDIALTDRATAVKFLSNSNNNVEMAIGAYFTNPSQYEGQNLGYDESQFYADRNGTVEDMDVPSFTIDAGEDSGVAYPGSSAPTRPNSRLGHHPAASGQEKQTSGTIDSMGRDQAGRSYFGPPTRDASSYIPDRWALIPTSSVSRLYANQEASMRARELGAAEPVMMKPLSAQDPLPSLIAILGQIPLARKALLMEQAQLEDYGFNAEWWDGKSVDDGLPRLVALEESDRSFDDAKDIVAETQRLMAFIVGSSRSYGSVEALSHLPALSEEATRHAAGTNASGDLRFLTGWSRAADMYGSEHAWDLFRTTSLEIVETNGQTREDKNSFYRLELSMTISEPKQTIYQAVDDLIWSSDPNGTDPENYCLEKVAPILALHVSNKDISKNSKGLGMQVPSVCYVDRYARENMTAMKQMRHDRFSINREIKKLGEQRNQVERVKHPKDATKTIETKELFKTTIEHLKKRADADGSEYDISPEGEIARSRFEILASKIERYYEKVQSKLQHLNVQQEELNLKLEKLSAVLTSPESTESSDTRPTKAYYLRGAAIGPNWETTYVYLDAETQVSAQTNTSSAEMDIDTSSQDAHQDPKTEFPSAESGRWWKFEYPPSSSSNSSSSAGAWGPSPVKFSLAEEHVLRDLSDDAKEVLLIYANAAASNSKLPQNVAEISPELEVFLAKDNAAFAEEITRERQRYGDHDYNVDIDVADERGNEHDVDHGNFSGNTEYNNDNAIPLPSYSEAMGDYRRTRVEEQEFVDDDGNGDGGGFEPDPGEALVSHEEYLANTHGHSYTARASSFGTGGYASTGSIGHDDDDNEGSQSMTGATSGPTSSWNAGYHQ